MNQPKHSAATFLRSEDGPVATEYAVLLALILLGVIATMTVFGDDVMSLYVTIRDAVGAG